MKYWAYVNNEILGPFEKEKLLELPSFSPSLLVCPQTPVGEKTEDWKETSTYPELSALLGRGTKAAASPARGTISPSPSLQENQAPATEPVKQPFIDGSSLGFKPLSSSQTVEPVPPAENVAGMMDIAVNRLGKAGAEPAGAPSPQQASSFDPISLSHIERRSGTLSGPEMPAPAPEGIALEPQRAFPQSQRPNEEPQGYGGAAAAPGPQNNPFGDPRTSPGIPLPVQEPAHPEMETFYNAPASAAPQKEAFYAPPAGGAPAVTNMAGLENLIQRLDALAKTSATHQDVNSAVEPMRLKLDQMVDIITSMKTPLFQRDVVDKLTYLEKAVSELKESVKNAQNAPAAAKLQRAEVKKDTAAAFGAAPTNQTGRVNPFTSGIAKGAPGPGVKLESAEPVKPVEIADTGTNPSKIVPAIKKIFKFIITLVLLAAVLLVAVIGMKNAGVYDATKLIPFPLPFTGAQPAPQQPATDLEEAPPAQQPNQKAAPQPPSQETAQKKSTPPEATPEIIYITRTFKLKPGGQSLESKIDAHSAKAGGSYAETKWEVRPDSDGMFQIDAVIPVEAGSLTYSYLVDRAKKTVTPANEEGKATFNELAKTAAQKPAAKRSAKQKGATKPAAKQPKKAAAKKQVAAEEEYEYVDEEEAE